MAAEKEYTFWNSLAERAAMEARTMLTRGPDPRNALVLTNAGYAVIESHTTEPCLDGSRRWKGASPGKATLLEVHSARSSALWFFFYDMGSGDGIYCEVKSGALSGMLSKLDTLSLKQIRSLIGAIPAGELFTTLVRENVKAEKLLANPDGWNQKVQAKVFGGREFAIVTLANAVPHGTPYDLIKSALFHDHYCPGVTSGYLLLNYLEKHFPLRSPSDKYFVLSIPPWCKDDAFLTLLNATPGKSGYALYYPTNDDKAKLKEEAKEIAGIFFRRNAEKGLWEGMVLSFSFAKVTQLSGIDTSKGYGWDSRLKMDLWLLDYLDRPELFIGPILELSLKPGESPSDLARPGVNPLERLQLLKTP
jgi:formylmethanofuran dehydrogenase subunit E-like metal-binding protein